MIGSTITIQQYSFARPPDEVVTISPFSFTISNVELDMSIPPHYTLHTIHKELARKVLAVYIKVYNNLNIFKN